jgi:hypothetical protein
MVCPKCGGMMRVDTKPTGFLHLYGVSCPVCAPAESRRQNRIVIGCAILLIIAVVGLLLYAGSVGYIKP